jgi:hypothetical protein
VVLDLDNGIEGWCPRLEERTGLSSNDVEDSRCELVLDWLFPQQHDRDRVTDCFHHPRPSGCQLVLDVVAPNGSQPTVCTFLPLPSHPAVGVSRRWLLLIGEAAQVDDPNPIDGSNHLNSTDTLSAPLSQHDKPEA